MKINLNESARKLSLAEIKELPKASVIWLASETTEPEGIKWFAKLPIMVYVPGEDGAVIGANEAGYFDRKFSDLFNDTGLSYWDKEPENEQLCGITEDEFNQISNGPIASALTAAIIKRYNSFHLFCEKAGFEYESFLDGMAERRDFSSKELLTIFKLLDLTEEETNELFAERI